MKLVGKIVLFKCSVLVHQYIVGMTLLSILRLNWLMTQFQMHYSNYVICSQTANLQPTLSKTQQSGARIPLFCAFANLKIWIN